MAAVQGLVHLDRTYGLSSMCYLAGADVLLGGCVRATCQARSMLHCRGLVGGEELHFPAVFPFPVTPSGAPPTDTSPVMTLRFPEPLRVLSVAWGWVG